MNKFLTLLTAILLTSGSLFAQDPHFSQFYNAPLQMSPAFIGVFEGSMRGSVNYRSQWGNILEDNPYRTIAASYDAKIPVSRDDNMGVSLSVVSDKAGPSKFGQFNALLGGAYQKKVGGVGKRSRYRRSKNDQFISAGFQVGAGQMSVNTGSLWFSNQYDATRTSVDLNAPSGEIIGDLNSNVYLDMNAGLMWYAIFDDNKSVYVGGSLHHANAPSIRFFQNGTNFELLRWRFTGQIGSELPISEQLSVLPAFIVQTQGVSQMFLTGANLRYNARDWREVALRTGVWTRIANRNEKGKHLDAVIVSSVLEMEKMNIGLSYDINVSKLTAVSNYRGAFELSIQYIQPPARRKNKVVCPRF
jgi:type IX secretion system PorP/SprF family membrane protein